MKRYLSVWLPRWPVERRSGFLASAQGNRLPPDGRRPLVLSTMAKAGAQITAINAAAQERGFLTGMKLSDARAIDPELLVEAADEKGDLEALERLALWCQRYSPLIRIDAPDGISIDISGCAHLFGGEAAMAEDIADRLFGFGLTARIAIAPTAGAAWALAHHSGHEIDIVSPQELVKRLSPLPCAALRIDAETLSGLAKLGLSKIGLLHEKPRASLASRFGNTLLYRLDQALGHETEAFEPISPPPHYLAICKFAEPIVTLDAVEEAARHLVRDLTEKLFRAGKGARRLELSLYRLDGWQERLGLRISNLSRDASHLSRLLCERLDGIRDNAGFGFESATLGAFDTEELAASQVALPSDVAQMAGEGSIAELLDRLVNRFGPDNVRRFIPYQSYLPERSYCKATVLADNEKQDWSGHVQALQGESALARPLMLFERPEEISAIFEMPDKPPVNFTWRRINHRVTRADGPERIAPEWWRTEDAEAQTRDYYRVEDEVGQRFWLYRDGLFERPSDDPKWFIHGLFP